MTGWYHVRVPGRSDESHRLHVADSQRGPSDLQVTQRDRSVGEDGTAALEEEMRAARGVVRVGIGEALGVVLEGLPQQLPDGGSLGCPEVRRGDLADATSERSCPEATRLDRECRDPGAVFRRLDGRCLGPSVGISRAVHLRTLHLRRGERSRLPVTLHEGLLRNGKYSSEPAASAVRHFLVAIALVAAISPGLAIAAANGAPSPFST